MPTDKPQCCVMLYDSMRWRHRQCANSAKVERPMTTTDYAPKELLPAILTEAGARRIGHQAGPVLVEPPQDGICRRVYDLEGETLAGVVSCEGPDAGVIIEETDR